MKKIILEEHFLTPETRWYNFPPGRLAPNPTVNMGERLIDIEKFRLPEMDQNGIDMQVLSLNAPGIQGEPDTVTAVKRAKQVNDALAEIVRKHPTRFAGFASLALQDPNEAANELERTVTQLGFKGTLIHGHTNGEYLDEQKFWPVFERAQALDVPIYLHPNDTPHDQMRPYGEYPELLGATWNWGVETATHALRMIFGGVFDAFPQLKLVLGHLGEMLPYVLWRLDDSWARATHSRELKKVPSQYIKDNMLITTSGNFSVEALLCALATLGADRVLFSVDYPYQPTQIGVEFIETAPISEADKEKIFYRNAEKLLKL